MPGPGAPRARRLGNEISKSPFQSANLGGRILPFSEELERPGFQGGLGVLPSIGGELLLICQAKQMWRGDNIYFHNSKQIW